jgi:butyryl-CoA dehydrogenase
LQLSFTKEQELIRDTLRAFSKKEIGPVAAAMDREHRFPSEILEKLKPLGFLGALIPPEYGGAGIDKVAYCLGLEEIAYGCASTSVTVAVHTSVATSPILGAATSDQKQEFLPPLASGDKLGAFAVTEPGAGSDLAGLQTSARREGNDYVVDGSKVFITNGTYAGQYIVAARTGKDPHKGLSLFVVDRKTDGLQIGGHEEKMGLNASDTARLSFEGMHVHKDRMLGKEGDGFKILVSTLNASRLGIGSQALGIARRALDESLHYAKQRKQFGVPLAQHQMIQFYLADMATKIDAATLMLYNAAHQEDRGTLSRELAAMTKVFSSEVADFVTHKAVQIHGGNGYIKDYVVERLLRDARVTRIYEGTSEIQRGIIGKALTRA